MQPASATQRWIESSIRRACIETTNSNLNTYLINNYFCEGAREQKKLNSPYRFLCLTRFRKFVLRLSFAIQWHYRPTRNTTYRRIIPKTVYLFKFSLSLIIFQHEKIAFDSHWELISFLCISSWLKLGRYWSMRLHHRLLFWCHLFQINVCTVFSAFKYPTIAQ